MRDISVRIGSGTRQTSRGKKKRNLPTQEEVLEHTDSLQLERLFL